MIWKKCIVWLLSFLVGLLTVKAWIGFQHYQEARLAEQVLSPLYSNEKWYARDFGRGNFTSEPGWVHPENPDVSLRRRIWLGIKMVQGYSCFRKRETGQELQNRLAGRYGEYLLWIKEIKPKTQLSEATFKAIFIPANEGGKRTNAHDCYFVDQTGVIRHSGTPEVWADENSAPLN